MFERFTTKSLTATAAALLAALGVGGAALAQSGTAPAALAQPTAKGTQGQQSTAPKSSAADPDNVQQGDQTGPETNDKTEGPESANDKAEGPESANEKAESSSEKANDDGPGGHADEPGNPAAGTQQQGQN